jgi:hypothetical protein
MDIFSDEALDRFDQEQIENHKIYAVEFKGFNFGARMFGLMKRQNLLVNDISRLLSISIDEADALLGLEDHPKTLTLAQTYILARHLNCSRQFLFLGLPTPDKAARPERCQGQGSAIGVAYEYRSFIR